MFTRWELTSRNYRCWLTVKCMDGPFENWCKKPPLTRCALRTSSTWCWENEGWDGEGPEINQGTLKEVAARDRSFCISLSTLCCLIILYLFLSFFWLSSMACGILASRPGTDPMPCPPAVKAQSLKPWTAGEAPHNSASFQSKHPVNYIYIFHFPEHSFTVSSTLKPCQISGFQWIIIECIKSKQAGKKRGSLTVKT